MARTKRQETILVVDDIPDTLEMIHRSIEHMGFRVFSCVSASEAIKTLKENQIDLVITDHHMPFFGGLDLIRHVRENYRNTEVMMITGYASVGGAIEAIKAGAEEYLAKPFTDEELEQAIERSLEKLCIRTLKKASPSKNIAKQYGILGESDSMKRVFDAIEKAAASNLPTLISGETGTGKELVARAIHYESKRANYPFIHVKCSNIPESILEKEIFGYVQVDDDSECQEGPASSGLEKTTRPGFLEAVQEGTVFFDEISETSTAVQVKLLSALTSGEITCVGITRYGRSAAGL
jgi:DNA-binding NtrC family response regulator